MPCASLWVLWEFRFRGLCERLWGICERLWKICERLWKIGAISVIACESCETFVRDLWEIVKDSCQICESLWKICERLWQICERFVRDSWASARIVRIFERIVKDLWEIVRDLWEIVKDLWAFSASWCDPGSVEGGWRLGLFLFKERRSRASAVCVANLFYTSSRLSRGIIGT